MKIITINGQEILLQDQWLRITENPKVTKYPKIGDVIEIKNHCLMPNGTYFVTFVKEYEPPYIQDLNGRDIRIDLLNKDTHRKYKTMNGKNILSTMRMLNDY